MEILVLGFCNLSNKYSKSKVPIQNYSVGTAVLSFVGKLRIIKHRKCLIKYVIFVNGRSWIWILISVLEY